MQRHSDSHQRGHILSVFVLVNRLPGDPQEERELVVILDIVARFYHLVQVVQCCFHPWRMSMGIDTGKQSEIHSRALDRGLVRSDR